VTGRQSSHDCARQRNYHRANGGSFALPQKIVRTRCSQRRSNTRADSSPNERVAQAMVVFQDFNTLNILPLDRLRTDNQMPILEAVQTLNSYGMEVVSGMIMGLDTDTYDTPNRILEFVEASNVTQVDR
jgi:hypothetical protein